MLQTKKVVQYVNKVGGKFYARKKILPFVLNPPQISQRILTCNGSKDRELREDKNTIQEAQLSQKSHAIFVSLNISLIL